MGWGVQVTARPTIEEPEHGHPDLHAAGQIVASSPREIFWRLFRRDRAAMASLVFLAIMILLAITAPLISSHIMHHGPNQLFITETLDNHGCAHIAYADDNTVNLLRAANQTTGPCL